MHTRCLQFDRVGAFSDCRSEGYFCVLCSGTHGYMAPEVILKGVQYSFTADWFSLGCVLHKLLLG